MPCWRPRSPVAQGLPTEPITLAGGRLVVGAEVTATFAADDPGFFNYTNYEFSALRNFRMGVSAEIRANHHVQVLGEVRLDHGHVLRAIRLVRAHAAVAGAPLRHSGRPHSADVWRYIGRGTYGTANMLIGKPLAYQYLTSTAPGRAAARQRRSGAACAAAAGCRTSRSAIIEADRGLPIVNS